MISRRFAGEFFFGVHQQFTGQFFWFVCDLQVNFFGSVYNLQVNFGVYRRFAGQCFLGAYLRSKGQFWSLSTFYRSIWDLSTIRRSMFSGSVSTIDRSEVRGLSTICRSIFCWECIYDLQVNFGVYRRFAGQFGSIYDLQVNFGVYRRFAGQFFFWERIYDLQVNFLGLSAIYRSILGYICDLQVNFGVYLRFTGDVWCLSTSAGKFWGLSAICRSI